jgi:hypothetical protein
LVVGVGVVVVTVGSEVDDVKDVLLGPRYEAEAN